MLRREFVKYLTAGAAGQFILPMAGANAASTLNVFIIGGGMAGATAAKYLRVWAKRLAIDSLVSVTIIDKSDKYVSNIMSNMVLTGEKTLTSLTYGYANLTTKYGVKFIKAAVSSVDTTNGWIYGKLNNTGSDILLNGTPFNRLVLAAGISFDYSPSNFTLNVPGTVYGNPYDAIPHAWQAGPQTTLLRSQLVNLKAGNHVAITIPPSPYRCPPGPYERACHRAQADVAPAACACGAGGDPAAVSIRLCARQELRRNGPDRHRDGALTAAPRRAFGQDGEKHGCTGSVRAGSKHADRHRHVPTRWRARV